MAVLGASGSGKSTFVKREISRGHPRLLIWDPLAEYEGHATDKVHELLAGLRLTKFRLVFRPSSDDKIRAVQFDLICRAALAAGRLTFIVEELRFVTTPSRAPVGWARVCLTGRHRGLTVYGLSQRPASIDKDFLGNCTRIRTGRLAYPEDLKAVRKAMGIAGSAAHQVDNLQPLEWVEKDMTTGKFSSGRLKF